MSSLERNPQVPAPTPHKVLGPGKDARGIPRAPEQLARRLAFPEVTERVPEVPVVIREHMPQLEKIQEVFPSRRGEAHFRSGISRQITPINWKFQRVLHTLAATQEDPQNTRIHSRGSTRVPPTSRGAPFPPHSSRGGIHSLRGRKRFPAFPSHLKRRRSPQERREELQGRATIPRVPQMSQSIPGKTCFPCTASTFKPRIDSHHGGTWDIPVGKLRAKASLECLEG